MRMIHTGLTLLLAGILGLQAPVLEASSQTRLLPFFDNVANPVPVKFPTGQRLDISPPAPSLTSFDRAVLQACGAMGTRVRPGSFKQLLVAYPDVLRQLQVVAGGELLPGRQSEAEFRDDLTAVWFDRQGFEHIFCGELEGARKIGGLHFVGRYEQLQSEGIGGRLPNNSSKEEVVPGLIYTLGVVIHQGDRTYTDDRKGYPYLSSALEILLAATKAYKAQGNAQGACILTVQDQPSGKSYKAVFVKSQRAIVTFYPDATPTGKRCR